MDVGNFMPQLVAKSRRANNLAMPSVVTVKPEGFVSPISIK